MDKINVTQITEDLIKELMIYKISKNEIPSELYSMVIEYMSLILNDNNISNNNINTYTLINILKDEFKDDYVLEKFISEFENKIFRISYEKNFLNNTHKEEDKIPHKPEPPCDCNKKANFVIRQNQNGEYYIANLDEVRHLLPKPGETSSVFTQVLNNGKAINTDEYIINHEGKVIFHKELRKIELSELDLNTIYSDMDDNLVYHDDDYLNFISKNKEKKENHDAPKPEFTPEIDFKDHDCDFCDEDCHDSFGDDRKKVIRRKKNKKAREIDL